jgi:hypothetical protein
MDCLHYILADDSLGPNPALSIVARGPRLWRSKTVTSARTHIHPLRLVETASVNPPTNNSTVDVSPTTAFFPFAP